MSGCLEPRLYDQRWSCLARLSSTVPQQRIRMKSRTNEENGTKEEEAAGTCRMCLGIAEGFAGAICMRGISEQGCAG